MIRVVDSQGRGPCLRFCNPALFPPGMALVLADHEGSFDSRYFGLIPRNTRNTLPPPFGRLRNSSRTIRVSIPLDLDVADFMGAFNEDAIALADMIEEALLTINGQGEVVYEER